MPVVWRCRGRDEAPDDRGAMLAQRVSLVGLTSAQIGVHLRKEGGVRTATRECQPDFAHRHADARVNLEQRAADRRALRARQRGAGEAEPTERGQEYVRDR